MSKNALPPNVTPEQAEQIYRAGIAAYQKRYRDQHPEKVLAQRLRSYVRTLTKHGYTVIAPDQEGGEG